MCIKDQESYDAFLKYKAWIEELRIKTSIKKLKEDGKSDEKILSSLNFKNNTKYLKMIEELGATEKFEFELLITIKEKKKNRKRMKYYGRNRF